MQPSKPVATEQWSITRMVGDWWSDILRALEGRQWTRVRRTLPGPGSLTRAGLSYDVLTAEHLDNTGLSFLHHNTILACARWATGLALVPTEGMHGLTVNRLFEGPGYEWHTDGDDTTLTVVGMLQPAQEGGHLQTWNKKVSNVSLFNGDLVAIPASQPHAVSPIQKGVRITALFSYSMPGRKPRNEAADNHLFKGGPQSVVDA